MAVYQIMKGANATATSPANTDAQIVQPKNVGLTVSQLQTWQAVLKGTGSCSATVQLAGSNDGVDWTAISTIGLSATSADITPAVGSYGGSNQFEYYGAYLTALSGTNAAVDLTLST